MGREVDIESAIAGGDSLRRGRERNFCAAPYAIQTLVGQGHDASIDYRSGRLASACTPDAANFKDVGIVSVKLQSQRSFNRLQAVNADFQLLVTGVLV